MQCVSICDSLSKRKNSELFLKQLITGDEKSVTYDKNMRCDVSRSGIRSWSKHGQALQEWDHGTTHDMATSHRSKRHIGTCYK